MLKKKKKETKSNPIFDYLNSINFSKNDIMDITVPSKEYNPFVINKFLAGSHDTILYVQEMNERYHIPKEVQYQYLIGTIPRRKRFTKWPRKVNHKDLKYVKSYFQLSDAKAEDALSCLSEEQINILRTFCDEGGKE